MLLTILFFTFLASMLSLILVSTLVLHKSFHKISFPLVSFAAGALLATGFLDTFPEALNLSGEVVFLWVTLSFAFFFVVERLFLLLHHHDHHDHNKEQLKIPASFLLFGDALHNIVDGASIAAAFLVSFPLGVITTVAIFVHEIPHELGDFGILIHKGWSRKKAITFNGLSGAAALLGALIAFYLSSQFKQVVPALLAVATANFIYLSATDLLPEIHHKTDKKEALYNSLLFLLGIGLIVLLMKFIAA
jgi:zinc and cadmium transporter